MLPPTYTDISETYITLIWSTPSNGNSAITSYDLYWDNGSGTSNIELIDSLITNYTVNGLIGGTTYLFKVRAKNIYGYGIFSTELSILASDVPEEMPIMSTTISGTNVRVMWGAPGNKNSPIDAYDIVFMK